jgi:hypothetical protein
VAEKFNMQRGDIQNLMGSAASFAASVLQFCREIEEFWAYQVKCRFVNPIPEG